MYPPFSGKKEEKGKNYVVWVTGPPGPQGVCLTCAFFLCPGLNLVWCMNERTGINGLIQFHLGKRGPVRGEEYLVTAGSNGKRQGDISRKGGGW